MLLIRQRSPLHGFAYDAFDAQGLRVGRVDWPWVAQARNARLPWHGADSTPGEIALQYLGIAYRIGWEYTRRGFTNDLRFLLDGPDGRLAMAEVLQMPGLRRPQLFLREPFEARLVRGGTWLRRRYSVQAGEATLGVVEEPHAFSLSRQLVVDLPPDVPGCLLLFLFFLVHNAEF